VTFNTAKLGHLAELRTTKLTRKGKIMNMNTFHANAMKCVSIWYANDKPGYNVAICDEPWTGFRGKWFSTQRAAIAHAKAVYPNVPLWKENRGGDYSRIKIK
tara:strand:- start:21 stop:326 length:306 start_codon:yes stop_codon:yes gene_type:complete